MIKAKLVKQVVTTTKNEMGMFENVTSVISEAKVNITGICAWSKDDKAFFALLTDNNAKAVSALSAKGMEVKEQEAVAVMLEDKVGAAQTLAKKIKDAKINLDYVYGTTCGCKDTGALMVLVSKENAKLISCLNG